jgi:hypothetical protein
MIPWWMWLIGLLGLATAVIGWSITQTPPGDKDAAPRQDAQWWR